MLKGNHTPSHVYYEKVSINLIFQMVNESVQTNDSKLPTLSSLSQMEASSAPLRLRGVEEDDEMQGIMHDTFTNQVVEGI